MDWCASDVFSKFVGELSSGLNFLGHCGNVVIKILNLFIKIVGINNSILRLEKEPSIKYRMRKRTR